MTQSFRYPTTMGVKERWWTYSPALATLAGEAFFPAATTARRFRMVV